MKSSISIVIPNFNGKLLLEANIPLVYNALTSSGVLDFEIIIPDDASTDDSTDFIKTNYPDIILIENTVNRGFAGNMNTGIFKSLKDLVFVLNSDVVLNDQYFKHLLPYFNYPDTFGVMSRIIAIDSSKIQDGAKYPNYSYGNIASCTNYISENSQSLYSLFLSGANALVDREKLIELGGFSEIFNPFYSEDVDLGLRAWRLGYKCYYEHNAICKHPNSETIKKLPSNKVKIVAKRNKMILHFIHLQNFELIFFLFILTIKTILRTIILEINYLKSFSAFICSIKEGLLCKAKFRALQKQKNIYLSVNDVIGLIHEKIGHSKIERF